MSSVKDIKKMLKGYRYSSQAAQDIHCLLENFRGLKLKEMQKFVHQNGSKENCISLIGTIPVSIRGMIYNIPISLWIRPSHPHTAPIAFVSPTSDMGMLKSQFVDSIGLINLPYIREWRHDSCDLTTLVQIMGATFTDNCPVFNKSDVRPTQICLNAGQLFHQLPPCPIIITQMPISSDGKRDRLDGRPLLTRPPSPSPDRGQRSTFTLFDGESDQLGGARCLSPGRVHGAPTLAIELCFVCEAPADVKFEPCRHSIMCNVCAQRAKNCPKCKKPVERLTKLSKVCSMCREDRASVTMKPCGHAFCQDCSRRLKSCFECKAPIDTKEGLRPVSGRASSPSLSESDTESTCPVCFIEQRDTAFMCGHQVCSKCAKKIDRCPICRKIVSHRIRLYS